MKNETFNHICDNQIYHRSLRLKEYDYSSNGAYFLTLCTYNRLCLFGKITGEEMALNKNGEIVRDELLLTPEIRPTLKLDAYAVMPNHLHTIIWIHGCSGDLPVAHHLEGCPAPEISNRLKPASVGAFVAGFKSAVTTRINKLRQTPRLPVWQTNYYEHVIRNETDLNEIRDYINYNPLKWALDSENPIYKLKTEWLATGRSPRQE
jgi:putative transposase